MKKYEYHTHLISGPQNGIYAEFPFDVKKEFGTRKPVWVKVTFDRQPFEMNLMPRGGSNHWLHVKKEIRLSLGKDEGDSIFVTLEKNDKIRTIKIPDYLEWLFENDPEMGKKFDKLSLFFRKYWIGQIEESKNQDTQVERINKLFDFLKETDKRK